MSEKISWETVMVYNILKTLFTPEHWSAAK